MSESTVPYNIGDQQARREKYWDELSVEEKVERMHWVVNQRHDMVMRRLEALTQRVEAHERRFDEHLIDRALPRSYFISAINTHPAAGTTGTIGASSSSKDRDKRFF